MLKDFLLIGFGGSLGAIARYILYLLEKRMTTLHFPAATLIINTLGCLCLGFFISIIEQNSSSHRNLLLFLVVGFLGSFTTFSTFSMDNYQLVRSGHASLAFLNIGLSLFLGLGAVWLGHKIYS